MPQTIRQNVDSVDDVIATRGAGARIEIQRDTTSAFAAPTSLTPKTLVARQTQYEIYDSAGAAGNWYRTRLTTSTGTEPSEWVIFQAEAVTAYATLASLREIVEAPDDSRDNFLSDLLVRVSANIDAFVGHDFYRHPAVSGTEIRTYDATGRAVLYVPEGIVSLTTVERAPYTGGTYATLVSTDYYLMPDNPRVGHPYNAIELSVYGSYRDWPWGHRIARLTGVFGYASVPHDIEQACLIWAAEIYRQGPGGGGPVGINQFGTPIFGQGIPRIVRDTLNAYRMPLVA